MIATGASRLRDLSKLKIGDERKHMPLPVLKAFDILKKATAREIELVMIKACVEVISDKLDDHFPLVV